MRLFLKWNEMKMKMKWNVDIKRFLQLTIVVGFNQFYCCLDARNSNSTGTTFFREYETFPCCILYKKKYKKTRKKKKISYAMDPRLNRTMCLLSTKCILVLRKQTCIRNLHKIQWKLSIHAKWKWSHKLEQTTANRNGTFVKMNLEFWIRTSIKRYVAYTQLPFERFKSKTKK